jgi:hypothetical protein
MPSSRRSSLCSLAIVLVVAGCASASSPTPDGTFGQPDLSSVPLASPIAATPSLMTSSPGTIAAGYEHTCVLTSQGGVRCWGANDHGQLGNGTRSTYGDAISSAVDVSGFTSGAKAVTAGGVHSCALTDLGGVRCWGSNEYGQLGDGTTRDSAVPVEVDGLSSGVAAVSAGWSSTCALTTDGGVMCWGHNVFGGLGDGTTIDRHVPVSVVGLDHGVRAIAVGGLHACAVRNDGSVACWGDGQADGSDDGLSLVPVDIAGVGADVVVISAAMNSTCSLTSAGQIVCWGPAYPPPIGATPPPRFSTVDVSQLAGRIQAIVITEIGGCALSDVGAVGCWSQAGTATVVEGLASDIVGVAIGGMHQCAVASSGEVSCWGSNGSGQLGTMTRCSTSSVPVNVRLEGDPAPAPTTAPTWSPTGRIEHPTGSSDVVLRLDIGPDVAVGELEGDLFQPGPEFTLYGDGTAIFRHDADTPISPDGPIVRAAPFMAAELVDADVQSLLLFALGEGGLADACDVYPTLDVDNSISVAVEVHADGIDRRVDLGGSGALDQLVDRLAGYDPGTDVQTRVWTGDRYWGHLFEAGSAIDIGLLPRPDDAGFVDWPWSTFEPADFEGVEGGWIGGPRRVMSADEAAILGLSDDGGVVRRLYLVGPDGSTIYAFSLWPMLPDEAS